MGARQPGLFEAERLSPEGLRYSADLITAAEEQTLAAQIAQLPFQPFEFHGYLGKRRVVSFGWRYDFGREAVAPAESPPDFLGGLRDRVAAFADQPPNVFQQVLVTEYAAGAGIGWHRDKAVFGEVVGVSLLEGCRLRFRRRGRTGWERRNLDLAPRSAYLLAGPARTDWEHSISPMEALRYSITFRTLAGRAESSPAR